MTLTTSKSGEMTPVHPDSQKEGSAIAHQAGTWCGYTVRLIEKGCEKICLAIACLFQSAFSGFKYLTADANGLAAFFRKLDKHVLKCVEHSLKIPEFFREFIAGTKVAVGVIDMVQVASDIDYFANAQYKKDNKLSIAAHISALVCDAGGAILWLEEMSFFSLSKAAAVVGGAKIFGFVPKVVSSIPYVRDCQAAQRIASTVGDLRVFGWISKISLAVIVNRALTLTYLFFAMEAFDRLLLQPGNNVQKMQAGLDFASYFSELVLDGLITVGVTSVSGLGAAGGACLILAFASLWYRAAHKEELKEAAKPVSSQLVKV